MGARPIWIAGAGLSGAVIARQLAEAGHDVTVCEARDHIAGNCYTERDAETGVLVHRYGPHIFHTGDAEVWEYIQKFGTFRDYRHKVWTTVGGQVFPLPVTLATINQFFGKAMAPDEARAFIAARTVSCAEPQTFEEQALAFVGPELYDAFFKGYTTKQWGRSPTELPASILKRLPLRFSYEGSYFNHPVQAMPEDGYTPVIAAMLDHPAITVTLGQALSPADVPTGAHLFWTGPLDAYFGHDLGHLGYRTLDFEHEIRDGDVQGCAVMNYGEASVPHTRITEHKHFAPWEDHARSVVTRECARDCGPGDVPYYPIRLVTEKAMLAEYVQRAHAVTATSFVGRLGTYRYLDMDVCIREALDAAAAFLKAQEADTPPPAFFNAPL